MVDFSFSQLFSVCPLPPSQKHFNLFTHQLSAIPNNKPAVAGSGIYAISRKDADASRLLYIGMHATSKPFHEDRVLKHLHTIIPVFHHALSLGRASYKASSITELQRCFDNKFSFKNSDENELYQNVKNNLTAIPHRNGNYPPKDSFLGVATKQLRNSSMETSARRFQYACHYWREVTVATVLRDYLNQHYELHWFSQPGQTSKALKRVEDNLIYKYRPVLNEQMTKLSGEGEVSDMLESPVGRFEKKAFRALLRDMARNIRTELQ